MDIFASRLIKLEKSIFSGRCVDVGDALPYAKTVSKEVNRIGNAVKEKLCAVVESIAKIGGAVSFDGVKCDTTGKKFNYWVVHYIDI